MKKVFISLMTIALVLGMMGIGVHALFSDTETSTGNSWTAGTLNLVDTVGGSGTLCDAIVTAGSDGINGNVVFGSVTPIVPGSSGYITWTLTNTGNIAGTLHLVSTVSFFENPPENEAEHAVDPTDLIGLGQDMLVWLKVGSTDIYGTTGSYQPMSGLQAALNAFADQSLVNGSPVVYTLNWKVLSTVTSEIQGDSATMGINFTLTQS